MNRGEYRVQGKKTTFRLHEKGGLFNEVPVHHLAEQYMDEYPRAARLINAAKDTPLFRRLDQRRQIQRKWKESPDEVRLHRHEAHVIVKRRAKKARLLDDICNHTFRGTGITTYLGNGDDRSKAATPRSWHTSFIAHFDHQAPTDHLSAIDRLLLMKAHGAPLNKAPAHQ